MVSPKPCSATGAASSAGERIAVPLRAGCTPASSAAQPPAVCIGPALGKSRGVAARRRELKWDLRVVRGERQPSPNTWAASSIGPASRRAMPEAACPRLGLVAMAAADDAALDRDRFVDRPASLSALPRLPSTPASSGVSSAPGDAPRSPRRTAVGCAGWCRGWWRRPTAARPWRWPDRRASAHRRAGPRDAPRSRRRRGRRRRCARPSLPGSRPAGRSAAAGTGRADQSWGEVIGRRSRTTSLSRPSGNARTLALRVMPKTLSLRPRNWPG